MSTLTVDCFVHLVPRRGCLYDEGAYLEGLSDKPEVKEVLLAPYQKFVVVGFDNNEIYLELDTRD